MRDQKFCRICNEEISPGVPNCPVCGVKPGFDLGDGINRWALLYFFMAGHCAPDVPIPLEVFCRLESGDGKRLAIGEVNNIVDQLVDLGLLKRAHLGLQMNSWVSQYAMAKDAEDKYIGLRVVATSLIKVSMAILAQGMPAAFMPLSPHVRKVADCAESAGVSYAGGLWNQLGQYQVLNGEYADARVSLERAAPLLKNHANPDYKNLAACFNNLGNACQYLGDLEQARRSYEQALVVLRQRLGPDHPEIASTYNNLGNLLFDLGDLEGAQKHFEKSLVLNKAARESDPARVAKDRNDLGLVFWKQSELVAARKQVAKALKIVETECGSDHYMIAPIVNNLGLIMHDEKDLVGARAAFERALGCDQARLGSKHPSVAIRLINLARVLEDMGEIIAATDHCEQGLKIFKNALPPGHPRVREVEALLAHLRGKRL